MSPGEGASGARLQVLLKRHRSMFVGELDDHVDDPRLTVGSVGHPSLGIEGIAILYPIRPGRFCEPLIDRCQRAAGLALPTVALNLLWRKSTVAWRSNLAKLLWTTSA